MMGTCGKKRKVAKPPSLNREAFDAVSPQTGELPWMACEIHDGFVQDASAARMLLETALHGGQIVDDGARAQVHRAAELLGKAIREARGLISGSRLPALEELGLVGAIEALIEDLPAGSPTVRFVTDALDEQCSHATESAVYRIVQQSLHNVRRHSRASVRRFDCFGRAMACVWKSRIGGSGSTPRQ